MQNRLYNDHAALYYLLAAKWERGQLHIPATTLNSMRPPRLSNSGVPPVIPQISIENTDIHDASPSPLPKNPWRNIPADELPEESSEFLKDPNLARYLKTGRRHTLGAAQNNLLITPEDLKHLREIRECPSSGLGSSSSGVQGPELAMAASATTSSTLHDVLSLGIGSYSSQNSMGSVHTPGAGNSRPYLQQNRHLYRRVSDGGPYAATYKLWMEKRGPLLSPINGGASVGQQACYQAGSSDCASVKQLLQGSLQGGGGGGGGEGGGEAGSAQYGRLPAMSSHVQRMQRRTQVSNTLCPRWLSEVGCVWCGDVR